MRETPGQHEFEPRGGVQIPARFSIQYAGHLFNVPMAAILEHELFSLDAIGLEDLEVAKNRLIECIAHLFERFGAEIPEAAPEFDVFLRRLRELAVAENWAEAKALFDYAREIWDFSGLRDREPAESETNLG